MKCSDLVEKQCERQQKYVKEMPILTVDDIGNEYWIIMWERTRKDCFDITKYPPFPKPQRIVNYNKDVYILPIDACYEDCNGKGLCSVGRCTCINGWHGESCNIKNCPNSLVYVDIDTINP